MSINKKILENLYIGTSSNLTNQPILTEHSHDECEIYLLTAGTCTYLIDNKIYTIKKGDLVVVPEHTLHRTIYDQNDSYVRMLCSIPVDLLPHNLYSLISKNQYVYRCVDKFEEILKILEEINVNYKLNDIFTLDAIKANITRLFVILLRENNNMFVHAGTDFFSSKVIDFIINNYNKDISLESVARTFYVTTSQLMRIFKKETKFTFWEYLLLYRIEKAKEFLRTTNKTVKEISHMCGFKDPNYFSTSFKRHTGYTPKAFRSKN